ncbi:MAG: fibronectin type III domain-containing protein [bacterium]|nr:fibronectin type III domain-containing protein [bacterium]
MRKHLDRLIVMVLSVAMILGMAPVTAGATKDSGKNNTEVESISQKKVTSGKKSNSKLKPFTSTEDLVADMKAEEAADPQKKKEEQKAEEEQLKQQKALAAAVEEKSNYTLNQIETEIEQAIFTNRDKKATNVSKYKLSKEEMTSIVTLILKQDHATTLVDVTIDADADGNATTLKAEIDPAFAIGLDELDKIEGVGEISGTVTEETAAEKSVSKSKARTVQKKSENAEVQVQSEEDSGQKSETTDSDKTYTYKEPAFTWSKDYSTCEAQFVANEDATKIQTVSCEIKYSVETEAGCETVGSATYTATCTFEGKPYEDVKKVELAATGHSYAEPTYDWIRKSDGTYSCRAIFNCQNCNSMVGPIDCKVTSTGDADQIIYTATCEFQGKTYSAEMDATTKKLYTDWAALCEFYSSSYEYYGIPTDYWMSKNTETTPMGAIKILAGYTVDAPIPANYMDKIIDELTQGFQAYVSRYGAALLEARDDALAQLDDNMTDLQKCLVLHDYIAQHAVFDMASLSEQQNSGKSPDPIEMTPFGALLSEQIDGLDGCICLGYTAAYAYLIQNAFPEIYRQEDGSLKSCDQLKDQSIVDFTMIKYDCDTAEVGVAGPDSGFTGRFNQPHFFNAVKVDGQWYFVDVCYDDIESETMTQYRVETDGNCRHMYFLTSYESVAGWYDGYYEYIDTLHKDDCNSKKYEDAWFTKVNCPIYYDDQYWYYVDTQMSYSQMSGSQGSQGSIGDMDSSQLEQMMAQFESPDYADRMKARKRGVSDDSEDGETILMDYGYGKVTNLKTGEQVTDDTMAAQCNEDMQDHKIYPELVHSLGLYENKLYFNLSEKIYMYDLETGSITQLKVYNDVYGKSNGSKFTGSSYYTTTADTENIDFHVVNHPIAALCIKNDDIMYVSIATNYSASKESDYKVESVNFNSHYIRFGKKNTETNDNKEFMWCANVKDNMNMSDIKNYLAGKGTMQEVTVQPWCGTQGYTENRDTATGCSNGTEQASLINMVEHHYIYNETEGCYICSRCHASLKKEDAESSGIKTGHTYAEKPTITWTKRDDGGYDCTATFECTCGDDTQNVPCTVTSKRNESCTDKGTVVYTATCTFEGKEYSDTKTDEILAVGHSYAKPIFTWDKKENQSYTCIATFTCSRCNDVQTVSCSKIEVVDQKDATCTEDGSITYRATCVFEGNEYQGEKTDVLPQIKHSYGEPSFVWARQANGSYTCTAEFTCINCNKVESVSCTLTEGKKTDATCTEDGQIEYLAACEFEGNHYEAEPKVDVLHAIGHTYGKPQFTWTLVGGKYTCTAKTICTRDGDVRELPCTVSSKYTAPTCTVNGSTVYTVLCTLDGKDYTESKTVQIPKLGHHFIYKDNGNATRTITCSRCNYHVVEKTVAAQPKNLKATSASYNSIKVSWSGVKGADSYALYQKTSSGWKQIAKVKSTSYTVKGVTTGQNYTFTVRAWNKVGGSTYNKSGVKAKSVLNTPKVKVASASYNSVKVSWNKVSGASGYYVYRWNGKKWTKIKTITSGKTCNYTNTKLTSGSSYKYTVAAYRTVNKKTKVSSGYNKKGVTVKPSPSAPKLNKLSIGRRKITVKWKKVAGASGYCVYLKNGSKLTKLKTITKKSITSWTNTRLKKGKKYTYVVRAYITVKGKRVYGSYSKSVTGKAK